MSAEVCLHFAATFLGFFLKVTAAYFACSILNRLVSKPRQRFIVWMIFLIGSAAYWLELVIGEIRNAGNRTVELTNAQVSTPSVTHSFLLPLAWSHSILIVIQALAANLCFSFLHAARNHRVEASQDASASKSRD